MLPDPTRTLADLLEVYMMQYLPTKAPTTQRGQGALCRWFQRELGTLLLHEVTPRYLRGLRDRLAQGRKPGTVRVYLDVLSAALTVAVEELEWLPSHPMRQVRKPAPSPGVVRFLSLEERDRLLAACRASRHPALYTIVLLALHTGARKREVLWLQWPQVALERQLIYFTVTKNRQSRAVPLSVVALEALATYAARPRHTLWVFPRTDGKCPPNIDHAWHKARDAAGLSTFRFHDLRHSAASYLAMSGASLLDIAEILGHKTMAMVRRYAHLSATHVAGVMQRMSDQFLAE